MATLTTPLTPAQTTALARLNRDGYLGPSTTRLSTARVLARLGVVTLTGTQGDWLALPATDDEEPTEAPATLEALLDGPDPQGLLTTETVTLASSRETHLRTRSGAIACGAPDVLLSTTGGATLTDCPACQATPQWHEAERALQASQRPW